MHQSNSVQRARKHLETIVNIAIVMSFLALVGIVGKRYVVSSAEPKSIEVGDKIALPDINLDSGRNNLLLFLQSDCKYSREGAGFYVSLAKNAMQNPQSRIIAVFSKGDDRYPEFLKDFGLEGLETRQVNFNDFGVLARPTLALVGGDGSVRNVWVGTLAPKEENEVRKQLGLQTVDFFLEEPDLSNLLRSGQRITVVDSRSRDEYSKNHFENALNIPADELPVRAINELPQSETIAVYGKSTYDGEVAQQTLAEQGFRGVYILRFKPN